MKAKIIILSAVALMSLNAFATSPGNACLASLTKHCGSVTSSAISSALNCRNEYSVRAMEKLTAKYCLNTLTNKAVAIAAKVDTEEEAVCVETLIKNFSSVTNSALSSCVSFL